MQAQYPAEKHYPKLLIKNEPEIKTPPYDPSIAFNAGVLGVCLITALMVLICSCNLQPRHSHFGYSICKK